MSTPDQEAARAQMREALRDATRAATDRLLHVLNTEFPSIDVALSALLSTAINVAHQNGSHAIAARAMRQAADDLLRLAAGEQPEHAIATGDVPVVHRTH